MLPHLDNSSAGGFIAVLGGWVAAVGTRRVIPILLALLASVPFAPLALFALDGMRGWGPTHM
ncbi:MAG: hypothetical protein JHC70_03200 [Rhodococcus sp.]|nr:hypothetical protein [Rhodococcus sp. (in: high G+C Gram-positive bacteria)]